MGQTLKAEHIRRLLSEYAAGSITDADRRTLLTAALEDPVLFEALALEQPLADLMADPASRAELREALQAQRRRQPLAWLWQPWPMTAAATVLIAILAVMMQQYLPESPVAPPAKLAALKQEEPTATIPPASQPVFADKGADAAAGNTAGGTKPSTSGGETPHKRAAAAPPAQPSDSAKTVGGVVGGVMGGIIPPQDAPKALRETASAPAVAVEAPSQKKDGSRLLAVSALELRYRVQRRSADGQFQEVSPDTRFAPGDAARLLLEPQVSGYLSVAELTEDGTWKMIYPPQGISAARVPAQASILLPAANTWEFGPTPRERRLLAVFTILPQPALVTPDGLLHRPDPGNALDIVLHVLP